MQLADVHDKVLAKLMSKPHIKNLDAIYVENTIEDAINDVIDFVNHTDLDERMLTPITDLCVIRLNLTGVEGLTSSGKAGTSESYTGDIPNSIKRKLKKYRCLS